MNTEGPVAASQYRKIPKIGTNNQDEAEEEDEELNSSGDEVELEKVVGKERNLPE